jgi:formylglycine-generating enzyme required for sulfatase activity
MKFSFLKALPPALVTAAVLCGCPSLPVDTSNSLGMEFVLIPAGMFMMGCAEGDTECQPDERPPHPVQISEAFYLGRFEVTQGQWVKVMGENPSQTQGNGHPVENVSWDDAQEFIRRLNALEGTDKYRLPTEAEWEYAARAGTATKFPFSEAEAPDYAWYWDNAAYGTHPVGAKQPNPWGLHDMAGNVWEWVQDWYGEGFYAASLADAPGLLKLKNKDPFATQKARDPAGPAGGASRVLRGGSWGNGSRYLRPGHRNAYAPDTRRPNIGFRLAVTPDAHWLGNVKDLKKGAQKRADDAGKPTSALPVAAPTPAWGTL